MKKTTLVFTSLMLFVALSLSAQKNVIKIRPASIAAGEWNFTYERAIAGGKSVALNLSYLSHDIAGWVKPYNTSTTKLNTADLKGYLFMPQFRFYSGDAPRGFYFAPNLTYGSYSMTNTITDANSLVTDGTIKIATKGIGALIGYQWLIGGRVSIDWNFFGLGVNATTLDFTYNAVSVQAIDDATNFTNTLNNNPLFGGYVMKVNSGTITVNGPTQILPALQTNFSLGIAF